MADSIDSGLVQAWQARFADIGEQGIIWQKNWQHCHWVATPAMNALAKHMAQGLSVYTQRRIKSCERESRQLFLVDTNLLRDWSPTHSCKR